MAKKPMLLIDADVWAYQASAGAEEARNWGEDTLDGAVWTVHADENVARKFIKDSFEELMDTLGAGSIIPVISDNVNWRKTVLPTYKGNRADVRKPILLPQMRKHLREDWDAWQRPTLEGDDLLGILSGLHSRFPEDKIMVTIDKDLSTIPGYHYRPHQTILGVFEVTKERADKFHCMQGIAGDPTDGYKGCPGWGMQTAEEFLDEPYKLTPETFTTTRGKFAGVERTRWVKQECDDLWECILSLYQKEGLTEQDAIVQFQVARILRTSDYDFKKKEPILWTPETLRT